MAIELSWQPSGSASALAAAEVLLGGARLTDPRIAAALTEPTAALRSTLGNLGLDPANFFRHAVPLAGEIGGNRRWAEVVLGKLLGGQTAPRHVPPLAAALDGLEQALARAVPRLDEELACRVDPLRLQWEAHGPGLLAAAARFVEPELVPPSARVILVHPVRGGGGVAHPAYNAARIEAVLVHPLPDLPETLRLAWLLAQLTADLPRYQGELHRDRAEQVAALAAVPLVLAAAGHVDLAACDRATIERAAAAWLGPRPPDPHLAEVLSTWWETYLGSRPAWGVALAALDRMLSPGG